MTTVSIPTTTVAVTDSGTDVALTIAAASTTVTATGGVGPTGPAGPGVATGGSTGQVLVKASGTDYATAWTSSPTFGTATMTLGTATTLQAGTATLAAASIGSVSNTEIQYLDGLTEPLTTSLAGKVASVDLPYSVVVPAIVPVNASSVTPTQEYFATSLFNCRAFAGTAQNNYMEWTFFVAAGTYTLRVMHRNVTNGGIASISIDGGADLGTTIDTYAAVNASNNITDITGIALTAGRHRVRFTAKTKNASSSDYTIVLHGFALTRTGA